MVITNEFDSQPQHFTSCVTLGNLLNFSVPQFSHLQNGYNNSPLPLLNCSLKSSLKSHFKLSHFLYIEYHNFPILFHFRVIFFHCT